MTIADTILSAIGADEEVTNDQICQRTGYDLFRVCTYMSRLREQGMVEHVDAKRRPIRHRLAGAAKLRAEGLAVLLAGAPVDPAETIVGHARRTQPPSVFHLGNFA